MHFSHHLEVILLHCVCISFMGNTLKIPSLYWGMRFFILFALFVYFLCNLQSQNHTARNALIFIFALYCCVISFHGLHFLLVVATLILLHRISLKKFIEVNLLYGLLTLVLLIPLSSFGIIENNEFIIKTGELRYFYCFDNPNRMGSFLYANIIFASLFFVNKGQLFLAYLIELLLPTYIYVRTGSRSPAILIVFQFVFFLILRFMHKKFKNGYKLKKSARFLREIAVSVLKFSVIIFLFFTIFLVRFSSSGIMLAIDLILGRGRYLYNVMESYSFINLFAGFNFPDELPLDNSYIYILCCTNIFAYIILTIFVYRSFREVSCNFLVFYGPFVIAFLFYGIMESLLGYYSHIALLFYFLLLKSSRGEL